MLKRRDGAFISENTIFLCTNCNCFVNFFLTLLKYKQDNEIRTTIPTAIIVIINIEEKNEMIRKILVESKIFIKNTLCCHYIMQFKVTKTFLQIISLLNPFMPEAVII